MTPATLSTAVVTERAAWIREMMAGIRALPLETYDDFTTDPRNVAAAESYLRRGLEALLDLGRHILAKGFAVAATEYKDVGVFLVGQGVVSEDQGRRMRRMAGYRNRLVHFYHQVTRQELYEICTRHIEDVEELLSVMLAWCQVHVGQADAASGKTWFPPK